MKLHTPTPKELRMYPINFGAKRSKVKVTMKWLLKMEINAYSFNLYTYHETAHTVFPKS